MAGRSWLITGISSGFGMEIARQVLAAGDTVFGTVRNEQKIQALAVEYPRTLIYRNLEITDTAQVREVVEEAFAQLGGSTWW